jgi:2-keto-4-pentenoate hydratase/2-oxohepta-3-ene-1,7-dioic acid hydratase in catechol pathway
MKIGTVLLQGRTVVVWAATDDTLVDLTATLQRAGAASDLVAAARSDAVALIPRWAKVQTLLERLDRHDCVTVPRDGLTWLPPVQPSKVCCVALNNRAMDADRISGPEHPAFFLKAPSSLIGHQQPIVIKPEYGLTHPEPELAVVVGTRLTDADLDTARKAVFGLTILNDITSVDMRVEDHFHFRFRVPGDHPGDFRTVEHHTTYAGRYKGADTFGPLGPLIVTTDEISDPDNLCIRSWADGELIHDDRTTSYRFNAAQVLSFISRFETLVPGDVVSLGTAVGTSNERRRPLSSIDLQHNINEVSIQIESLGTLINPVQTMAST